jgi:hypothetical protein
MQSEGLSIQVRHFERNGGVVIAAAAFQFENRVETSQPGVTVSVVGAANSTAEMDAASLQASIVWDALNDTWCRSFAI